MLSSDQKKGEGWCRDEHDTDDCFDYVHQSTILICGLTNSMGWLLKSSIE